MKPNTLLRAAGILAAVAVAIPARAQQAIIPPAINRIWPAGMERGTTATFALEGRNLTGATVLFDAPGLSGKVTSTTDVPEEKRVARPGVDTGAIVRQAVKQEAKLEVTAAKDAEPGIHWLRVQTPLGTSNLTVLAVGALPEVQKKEATGQAGAPGGMRQGQHVELPATIIGTVAKPGDADAFEFSGKAGQELVFQVVASELGSALRSELTLRDARGNVVARSGYSPRQRDAVLAAKLPFDGKYTIAIADREKGGGMRHFYRLNAGALPYLTGVFPLGVRAGGSTEVEVRGVNLGDAHSLRIDPPASADGWTTIPVVVKTAWGKPLNELKLAVGNEPEITEQEPNDTVAQAQPITIPVTINGRIHHAKQSGEAAGQASPDEDFFRFHARKGERVIVEVAAARLGSPLDSVVEVLDAQGREIPRATVRCLSETDLTLGDRDSGATGFRLVSLAGLHDNDYLMAGDELVQITRVPDQPDEDVSLKSFEGQRISMLDTSPQVHPLNQPIYKARIEPPDAKFPPNGLPVFHLTMRNDDGGPGFGSDSRLHFTAPTDAEYVLHIRDVRGLEGPDYAYRLTVRDATPDYTLTASPENPNVPRGGRLPVEVTANRTLGYDGPIELKVKGLPQGITAQDSTIPAGRESAVVIFQAAADAPAAQRASPLVIEGHASIGGRDVVRVADSQSPIRLASVIPPPDILVSAEPQEVTLEAGKSTTVTLHVDRQNGFQGRVPCYVRNLPPGVLVDNVGLNGVLVTEEQSSRTFTLRAEDWAWPLEQPIYVVGEVESNSPTSHASAPILLKVHAKQMASAGSTSPVAPKN